MLAIGMASPTTDDLLAAIRRLPLDERLIRKHFVDWPA